MLFGGHRLLSGRRRGDDVHGLLLGRHGWRLRHHHAAVSGLQQPQTVAESSPDAGRSPDGGTGRRFPGDPQWTAVLVGEDPLPNLQSLLRPETRRRGVADEQQQSANDSRECSYHRHSDTQKHINRLTNCDASSSRLEEAVDSVKTLQCGWKNSAFYFLAIMSKMKTV